VFFAQRSRWSCHFDDDNYVNVPLLKHFLHGFDHTLPMYIGRPSNGVPISSPYPNYTYTYWFATGGAGYCLSLSLLHELRLLSDKGTTIASVGNDLQVPDDIALAYLIYRYCGVALTVNKHFHSHLEHLNSINELNIHQQFVLSGFAGNEKRERNVVNIGRSKADEDPLRFHAIHCTLYPSNCTRHSSSYHSNK